MRAPFIPAALAGLLLAALPAAQEPLPDPRHTPVVDVVQRVKPAVVSIASDVRTRAYYGGLIGVQAQSVVGTGVVLFEDGYIITNNHVVEDALHIRVTFDETDDDREYEGRIISRVAEEDLALIKIEGNEPFPTVPLCESDPILGEPVVAIGNAFGHSHTVSTGIVSGLHREVRTQQGQVFGNLIQTDASINHGNSGGPLLNINGELIGINTAMQHMAENIGFAIPTSRVRVVLSEVLLSLSQAASWLGFDADPATFVVTRVVPGGPADEVGLETGDRLKALHGHLLTSEDDYRRVRLSIQPQREVALTIMRGKEEQKYTLSSWNQVDGILFERLGMTLDVVRLGQRFAPYLRVASVQPGGPAGELGLSAGDVITAIRKSNWRQDRWFQRVDDLAWLVSGLEPGTQLVIEISRDEDRDGFFFERDASTDEPLDRYRGTLALR